MQDHCASGESQWGLLQFKRDSDFRPALVPNIAQLSLEHLLLPEWYLHKRVRGMGVSLSPEFSGNAVLNPFSTAAVPVDPVEKEGGDPIENLLPALLQIFLTVRLDLHNISLPVKRWWRDVCTHQSKWVSHQRHHHSGIFFSIENANFGQFWQFLSRISTHFGALHAVAYQNWHI